MVYTFTNESIESIVTGLSVTNDDRVLSICSCAQPFAFLEYVTDGSVLAIDNNPAQIRFAKRIMKMIKAVDRKGIRELNLTPKDGDYFLQGKRINRIAANARRIRFVEKDIKSKPEFDGKFTKGYFSNTSPNLIEFHPLFETGALLYITDANPLLSYDIPEFIKQKNTIWKCRMSDYYSIDTERTKYACHLEQTKRLRYHKDNTKPGYDFTDWTPCVFIRK